MASPESVVTLVMEGEVAVVRAVERQVLRRQDVFDHIQRIKGQVDLFGSHSIHQAFNFFSSDGDSDERLQGR